MEHVFAIPSENQCTISNKNRVGFDRHETGVSDSSLAKVFIKYTLLLVFLFLSMNRIVAGYLYLFGVIKSNFNMPLYSPFGDMGLLGTSPLPRAYTGLGFSDSIQVYVKSQNNEYLINLDFQTFDTLARGHLYKYDVYLHSIS